MRKISDTISRLAAFKATSANLEDAKSDRLGEVTGFGPNPGRLRGYRYIPAGVESGAPLVVVLHGCTQTAAGYDGGSGWSALAEEQNFAVLLPEQQQANNANRCFNWFQPGDIRRGEGEVASIRNMIESTVLAHGLDPKRVYVTGLSAGGAMAAAMLATYPEVFAAGAIIAGLPYGCAGGVPEAFDRMRGHGMPAPAELQDRLAGASRHAGPWPRISVWHGTADRTVHPGNADAIVEQWRGVHGAAAASDLQHTVEGHRREVWLDATGAAAIESYRITGLGHGTPVAANEGLGAAAPFFIEAGISSTLHIARSWDLVAAGRPRKAPRAAAHSAGPSPEAVHAASARPSGGVGKIINDALRSAGLLK